jgi:hypothetical protein
MKVIRYNPINKEGKEELNAKYLPKEVFLKCFKKGELLHIDKTIAGSGMSHSFLTTTPKSGSVNILIAPNRQVVLSKEESYRKNRASFKNNIQFFCTGSSDSFLLPNTEIVVTTTDTCLKMFNSLSNLKKGMVLIDEYHSTIQGSLYRNSLRGFLDKIRKDWLSKDVAISTVSATPLLFSKVDITLIPTSYYRRYDIVCNDNYEEVIEEAKYYLRETNESVIVFTNSISVISQFSEETSDNKRVLRADLKVGSRLLESICKRFEIDNVSSKLTIGSSQAFEGFDIEESNIRVYFFQDLSVETEDGFNVGNIYQAINRTRNGYNSATYTKTPKRDILKSIDWIISQVINSKKVNKNNWGSFSKLSNINHLTNEDKFRFIGLLDSVVYPSGVDYYINEDRLNLEREKEVMINKGIHAEEYKTFLLNRNIKLIDSKSISKGIKLISTRNVEYYCYINREAILFNKLNEKDFLFNPPKDSYKKNYSLKRLIDAFASQYKTHLSFINYMQYEDKNLIFASDRQMRLLKQSFSGDLEKFLEALKTNYIKSKSKELRALRNSPKRLKDLKDKISKSKDNLQRDALILISILINDEPIFPENLIGSRDYNLLTKMSMSTIIEVCHFLRITVQEYDIKACNPRIIYASVGQALPDNFYGEGKVNKDKINTLLNLISKHSNNGKYSEAQYKANMKYNLKKAGVSYQAIEFLIDKFFNREPSALFNYCSFHEAKICHNVNWRYFEGQGVRRHDSLLLFNSLFNGDELGSFTYMGVDGWFKSEAKIKTNEKQLIKYNKQLKLW